MMASLFHFRGLPQVPTTALVTDSTVDRSFAQRVDDNHLAPGDKRHLHVCAPPATSPVLCKAVRSVSRARSGLETDPNVQPQVCNQPGSLRAAIAKRFHCCRKRLTKTPHRAHASARPANRQAYISRIAA